MIHSRFVIRLIALTLLSGVDEKLYYNDGGIRFTLSGAKCTDQKNYTVNVMLECDYNVNQVGAFHVSGSCEITIVQHTPLACLPIPDNAKNVNCMVKSPSGAVFNFNSLRNSNHVADGNGTKYIIGICNPVLNGHEKACEQGTSICLFDPMAANDSLRYRNMGTQTQAFKINKDDVSLTLTSNEPCGNDKKYSSKIHFECDRNAAAGVPKYHSTIDCINIFSWPTSVVCQEKKMCQVQNTETKADFDFSSLIGVQYEAVNKNNSEEKIKFSICSDAGEPCLKNTGSCVVKGKQSTSAGKVNSDLKLAADLKSPYLLYEDGAVCKTQGHKFTTRIDFICADNATDEGAVAIEDGCDITIHFKTLLACKFIKNCVGKDDNGEEIDLRPLIDFDGNYLATVNEKNLPKETGNVRYMLNVCRPLNSKYSLNCRGSSAACRTVVDENEKHEQELNLGHPDYSIHSRKVNDTNVVTMKYFGGGTCPADAAVEANTKIRFFCDEKVGLGNPVLQGIEDCEYEFDFPTNILCNEQSVDIENKSCNLVNDKIKVSVDLKLFGSDGVYKVGDKSVDICGGDEKRFYTIVYKQSLVRVEFSLANGKGELRIVTCRTYLT
jgi:insulin-like growth factor 2 receptor